MIRDSVWKPDPDKLLTGEEVEQWRRDATAFLEEARQSDRVASSSSQPGGRPQRKLERVAAYRHQVGLDADLQWLLGKGCGWLRFIATEEQSGWPLSRLPTLVLLEDRHSVNLSGMFFALFALGARCLWICDDMHNVWSSARRLQRCRLRDGDQVV